MNTVALALDAICRNDFDYDKAKDEFEGNKEAQDFIFNLFVDSLFDKHVYEKVWHENGYISV